MIIIKLTDLSSETKETQLWHMLLLTQNALDSLIYAYVDTVPFHILFSSMLFSPLASMMMASGTSAKDPLRDSSPERNMAPQQFSSSTSSSCGVQYQTYVELVFYE